MLYFYHPLSSSFRNYTKSTTSYLDVCPGENYTLSCTESGTAQLIWNWNDVTVRDYTAGVDNNINTTDLLLSDNNMMVSTQSFIY